MLTLDRVTRQVAGRLKNRLFAIEDVLLERRLGIESRAILRVPDMSGTVGDAEHAHMYTSTPAPLLRWVFDEISVPPAEFSFVDMGSGKGRTLAVAARLGFRRVIGVEFASELHLTAQRNMRRTAGKALDVELVLGDAARFEFPDGPFVVYFNNPFSETVMADVIGNMEAAYAKQPRPVIAVFLQREVEDTDSATRNRDLLAAVPFLTGTARRPRGRYGRFMLSMFSFSVYESVEVRAMGPSQ